MADLDLEAFTDVVLLGSGGLGDVYRATRRSTGGEVAIKVLRDWSDRDVAWQRAQRELRALVDLRGHSNVVNVEEVVESDGTLAIVMEYAPGGAISDLMRTRGGSLGFAESLLVTEHTAAALAAAHDRGIIHRDIKPHNLLIGNFGQVKVCDFGIASLTRSDDVSNRTSSLSLRYASPEELRGDAEVGPPADIYSLAATVHHLLTGRYLPVPDGTAGSLPLRSWHAPDDIPAGVELEFRDLMVRSGDRDAANRPTAEELRDRCEALSAHLGPARCRSIAVLTAPTDDPTTVRPTAATTTTGAPGERDRSLERPVVTAAATAPSHDTPPAPDPAITVSRTTVLPTAHSPADAARAATPPGWRRSVVVVGAFATLTAFVVVGVGAFAFGWFGSEETDAALATTAEPGDTGVASPSTGITPTETAAPTTLAAPTPDTTTPDTTTPDTTTPDTTTPDTTAAIPDRYAGPTCPGDGACIVMASIDLIGGEYSIDWSANFTPATAGTHAHFFWDVYDASQVGSASADRGPWELTDRQPFVPEGELRLVNRPAGATGICVTPADSDHAVIDSAYYHCALVGPDAGWTNPSL